MTLSAGLESFLRGMEYPATRDDLIREARRDGISTDDLSILQRLPEQNYGASCAVANALGAGMRYGRTLVAA